MILAQFFEHIAPNRKLAINGGAEVLVSDALNRAAQPYAGPPQPPQESQTMPVATGLSRSSHEVFDDHRELLEVAQSCAWWFSWH